MKRNIFWHIVIQWDVKIGAKLLDKTIIIDEHDDATKKRTLSDFVRKEVLKNKLSRLFLDSSSEGKEGVVSIEVGLDAFVSSFLDDPFHDGWGEFILGEGSANGQINVAFARGLLARSSSATKKKAAKVAPTFSPIQPSAVLLESKFSA